MIQNTELFSAPIVVGVDDSDTSRRALATAIELARHLHCHLVVVSAYRRLHDAKTRSERRDAPADVAFRRGRGRLKGSVPNDVSHSAPCSVLIVDTAGFVAA
jgi:nucleotide-binding universal stress UspA family protein